MFLDKFSNRKELKEADIIKIQYILQLIINFIFDLEESNQIDYFNINLDPIQENQKLLKDINLIDILIEIFYQSITSYRIQEFDPENKQSKFY